jgi:chemosensory pili system protein ChpA (sensor histidine kinase/response regulator)
MCLAAQCAGGTVRVSTAATQGTRLSLMLPARLLTREVQLLYASRHLFAVERAQIDEVIMATPEQWSQIIALAEYVHGEQLYEVLNLASRSEPLSPDRDERGKRPVVLLRSGERFFAVCIDELGGQHEAHLQRPQVPLDTITWIDSTALLEDGRTALIPQFALLQIDSAVESSPGAKVLVVDDSMTIRVMTERMLNKHGMSTALAKDGVEALMWLENEMPDFLLLDIEMPRMDGFELAATIRADHRLAALPIIMISSRSGEKHRQRAAELGVNGFLGKPYNEDQLLDAIGELTIHHGNDVT